jgi:hypothetical protein
LLHEQADLEYLRLGLIRVDKADHLLVDCRRSMKSSAPGIASFADLTG